ncbi:MAG: bis(5'-nucleosyl)-tetraphosphatase (symmetrical) YqeK [Candidatus Ornithomonoglobus sp.]
MNKKEMQSKLQKALKKKRFEHSIGVRDEAVRMAEQFGADPEKAYVAGLLHDCAKCLKPEEEEELIARYGYELDEMTRLCHPVLHAPLGALAAKYEYGVEDEEILDAIRYHTVARADMTLLDKIVYVSDVTEPNRDYDGVDVLRRLAAKSIDEAYKEAVRQALLHNIKKETLIHPNTLEAWNEICRKKL